jgi:LacI family transcriptional regulator
MRQKKSPDGSAALSTDMPSAPVSIQERTVLATGARSSVIDVATLAGVSIATVSRVLTGTVNVRPEKAEAVRRACETLGYVVNGAARALSSKRTWTIGAVVPTFEIQTFSRMIAAFQRRLHAAGYTLLLASSEFDVDVELKEIENLITHGIDGLLIVGRTHHEKIWDLIGRRGIPYIQTLAIDKKRPSVGYDNVAIGRHIAEHLLTLGHRHIGLIVGIPASNDRVGDRIVGLREGLAKAKRSLPDASIERHAFTLDEAMASARALLNSTPRRTALVCGNDMLAFGAMLAANQLGLRIPDDVSIVGFNNYDFSSHLTPPLTTVDVDLHGIGHAAAEYLIKSLQGSRASGNHRIRADLLVRGSSGPVRPQR